MDSIDVDEPLIGYFDLLDIINVKEKDTNNRRVFTEGERVLNAKHVLSCGIVMKTQKVIQFMALCLSSIKFDTPPYEVKISVDLTSTPKAVRTHCSCKAGNLACKHTSAVLFKIQR